MAYSDTEDVRRLLIGYRGDTENRTADVLDNDQLLDDIANADAQIDASLNRRYEVPFAPPIPAMVKYMSIDIAAYLADMRFRGSREYGSTHPVQLRYDRARRLLDDLGSGRRLLELATEDEALVINPYDGVLMSTRHVWTRYPEGQIEPDGGGLPYPYGNLGYDYYGRGR
jgi:phage gp36-like protein